MEKRQINSNIFVFLLCALWSRLDFFPKNRWNWKSRCLSYANRHLGRSSNIIVVANEIAVSICCQCILIGRRVSVSFCRCFRIAFVHRLEIFIDAVIQIVVVIVVIRHRCRIIVVGVAANGIHIDAFITICRLLTHLTFIVITFAQNFIITQIESIADTKSVRQKVVFIFPFAFFLFFLSS